MDAFGDNFDQPEVDPAADFLAREQDALQGLEDVVPPAASVIQSDVQPEDNTGLGSSESFEMINNEAQENSADTGGEDPNANDDFAGYRVQQPVKEEPEKIRKWREEQKTRLEQKDLEEDKKKVELREQAKKELEDWYKHHEEAISKTKSVNRNAEKQFVADADEIEPGTEWERIAKLCDFNPKSNKTNKDVSRMRSIILQLKQQPLPIKPKA